VKDVGVMIGKMVWEKRGENLVKTFEESNKKKLRISCGLGVSLKMRAKMEE
jgi:hypothetical protein